MATKNLSLEVNGYELDPRRFSIREALSRPFEVTVWARVKNDNVDLEKVVGGPATFTLAMDRRHRSWFGLARHAELVDVEPPPGESTYLIRIVPALWLLGQVSGHRIFQHKNLPDIIDEVLAPYQIKPKREFGGIYPDKEYIVQAGETDYAFVHRLLEEAGITYYYRFEGDKPELIFSDAPQQSSPRPGEAIHFVDEPHAEAGEDYLTNVRLAHRICPGKVSVRDHDFRGKPDFDLRATIQTGQGPEQAYEQYFYEPGAFLVEKGGTGAGRANEKGVAHHDLSEGDALAGRLLLSARRRKRSVAFETNAMDLAPGMIFKMANHPHPEIADSTQLLVNEFALEGKASGQWQFQGVATFANDGHPLEIKTPRQRVAGVQTAVVVGPKNKELYPDEYGRVRVQFHWDREGKGIATGEASSTWMRVSQSWAGSGFGAMAIPRIGQEVLVRYFEGDPEHPAVVGRVYNKLEPVPYPLPKHKAKSLIKTDTSKHQDAKYNEIRLDDRKDKELFFVQAQKDSQKLVRQSETERTGENRVAVVGGSRSAIVGNIDAVLVGQEHSIQIIDGIKQDDAKILEQKKPVLKPRPTKIDMVDKKLLSTTSSATLEMDDAEIIFEAKGELSLRSKSGSVIIEGGPKVKINCAGSGGSAVDPKSAQLARELIQTSGTADAADAEMVARELEKAPPAALQQLKDQGTKVVVCRNSVTEHLPRLKGVQPRGWPKGSTWDSVTGCHTNKEVVVAVTHEPGKAPYIDHKGSTNMVLHETGHGLDMDGPGASLNSDPAFQAARDKDKGQLRAYYTQAGDAGLQETYAESFAVAYDGSPEEQKKWSNLTEYWANDPVKGSSGGKPP